MAIMCNNPIIPKARLHLLSLAQDNISLTMGARTIRVSQSHLGPVFQVIVRLEGKPLEQMLKNNAKPVYIQRSPTHISRGTV